ncbi:hypothetical protein MHBO_003652 [Bonamia ostreae]|uniref:Uncharacterized protein n=1 Tax=Bonamia ostreae TaxID=126728 RepID=A0ABV2AR39_9EUKA
MPVSDVAVRKSTGMTLDSVLRILIPSSKYTEKESAHFMEYLTLVSLKEYVYSG